MSYYYTQLRNPGDWNAHAYPEGSICIVMVHEDGRLVSDDETRTFIEDHEVRFSEITKSSDPVFFGQVFSSMGRAEGMSLLAVDSAYPEIGQLWDSIEQAADPQGALESIERHANISLGMPEDDAESDREFRMPRALIGIIIVIAALAIGAIILALLIAFGGI